MTLASMVTSVARLRWY